MPKSFPGVSGQKSQQSRWGLRTGDGVRQEAPGARIAGTGGKGPAEKLTDWEGPPKAAHLIYTEGISSELKMSEEVSLRKQGYKVWRNPTRPGESVKYMGEFYPPKGHDHFSACDLKQLDFGPGEYTVLAPPDRPYPDLFSKWWKVMLP